MSAMDELKRIADDVAQIERDMKALADRKRAAFDEATAYASTHLEALTGLAVGTKLRRSVKKWSNTEWKHVERAEACIITGARVTMGTAMNGDSSVAVVPVGKKLKKNGEPSAYDADRWSLHRWQENGWEPQP